MGIGPAGGASCDLFPRSSPLLHRCIGCAGTRFGAGIHEFPANTNSGRNPGQTGAAARSARAQSTGLSTRCGQLRNASHLARFPLTVPRVGPYTVLSHRRTRLVRSHLQENPREADLSAAQPAPQARPRLPRTDVHEERPSRPRGTPQEGPSSPERLGSCGRTTPCGGAATSHA